jgi:hypothetical protein
MIIATWGIAIMGSYSQLEKAQKRAEAGDDKPRLSLLEIPVSTWL